MPAGTPRTVGGGIAIPWRFVLARSAGEPVTEFFVDAHGLTGLYNLLLRASEDATQTVEYTKRHCDLSAPTEGYLMVMLGPHALSVRVS